MYTSKYRMTHLVFDVYSPSSLKAETRSKRGQGGRRKVTNKNTMPSNWHNFLRHNDNKTELYHFLADKVAQMFAPNMSQRDLLSSALMKLVLMDWINALTRKLTAASLCTPNMLQNMVANPS